MGVVGVGFGLGKIGLEDGLLKAPGEGADVKQEAGAGTCVRCAGESAGEAGGGAGLHEGGAGGFADEVMDEGGLAEADLGFGGVDVDVYLFWGHFEEEQDDGEAGGRDDVSVGLSERVQDELIADEAVIDEDVDSVAVEALQLWFGDEAGDAEEAGVGGFVVFFTAPGRWLGEAGVAEVELGGGGDHEAGGIGAEDLEETLTGVSDGGCDEEGLGARVELKVAGGVGEGVVGDEGGDVLELGGFRLEEFAAGGGVEEEIADGDGGAGGGGRTLRRG